jgi:hypothetical protein
MTTPQILQCHVQLVDSAPPIWRRFHISEQATLAELHGVLQRVMGWRNCHRHQFVVGGDRYADPTMMSPTETRDTHTHRLADFAWPVGATFTYTYDFGDGWLHQITVESRQPSPPGEPTLACLAGERACPPEGSGGVWGYEELLERLNDPDDPDYEELLDQIGLDFDPEAFDPHAVNQHLSSYQDTL